MMISDVVNAVVEYLATLPDGTTISTSDAVDRTLGCKFLTGGRYRIGDEIVDTMGFFDIDAAIRKTAGEKGFVLDSTYCAGVPVGLPFNIPYTVTKADAVKKETPNSSECSRDISSDGRIVKLDDDWKDEFAPHILARGRKYYEEGRVSQLIQYENRITAHVDGTEDYRVEIDLPGGMPDNWRCTCPYAAQGDCKHKAAVLFAVEAGEYTFTGDPPEFEDDIPIGRPSLPWYDAIERLPADTLRKFLLDYAERNEEIREYLSIWYLHGLPEGLLAQWKENLQSYANTKAGGRRYVPENEVYYFMTGVRSALNRRLLLLRKVGATMDAFYWLGTAFEIAAKKVCADDDGEFEDFYYDCVEDWFILFSEATDEQREQMLIWFWEHRAAFFAHIIYADQICFLDLPWGEKLERKSLEIVDTLIANCHSDKELVMLMDCRIEIMDFLDCSREEVWGFWKRHLDHNYARHRLLDNYYEEEGSRVYIIPLLKQLKEMDADDLPRLIQDSVWLTMMYRRENVNDAYESERALLLTQYRQVLEKDIPVVLDKKSAGRFIACLDVLRSLKDDAVDQMIEELVNALCSNPTIARKGIVEMVNGAGYEWPKAYRFPG